MGWGCNTCKYLKESKKQNRHRTPNTLLPAFFLVGMAKRAGFSVMPR